MKKIKCVIMDWAGTAVDYGCFAPVAAFIEAFAEKGLIIDVVQTRKPMGLPKIQHIRERLPLSDGGCCSATASARISLRTPVAIRSV